MSQIIDIVVRIFAYLLPITVLAIVFAPLGDGLYIGLIDDFYRAIYDVIYSNPITSMFMLIDNYTLKNTSTLLIAGGLIAYAWRTYSGKSRLSRTINVLISLTGYLGFTYLILRYAPFTKYNLVPLKQFIDENVMSMLYTWETQLFTRIVTFFSLANAVFVGTSTIFPTESFITLTIITIALLILILIALSYFNRYIKIFAEYLETTIKRKPIVYATLTILTYFASSIIFMLVTLSVSVLLIYVIAIVVMQVIVKVNPIMWIPYVISLLTSILAMLGVGFFLWLGWEFTKTTIKHVPRVHPFVLIAFPMLILEVVVAKEIVGLAVTAIVLSAPIVLALYINGRLSARAVVEYLTALFIIYYFADILNILNMVITKLSTQYQVVSIALATLRGIKT